MNALFQIARKHPTWKVKVILSGHGTDIIVLSESHRILKEIPRSHVDWCDFDIISLELLRMQRELELAEASNKQEVPF